MLPAYGFLKMLPMPLPIFCMVSRPFASGSAFWGTLFVGIAAYAAWGFFIAFDPDAADDKPTTETDKD